MRTKMRTKKTIPSIVTKIGTKHQVTIPTEVFRGAGLEVGDYLEVRAEESHITMTPKKLILKDAAWFHAPEWQAKEKEADEAIAKGQMSGPFSSSKEVLAHLSKRKKKRP